MLGLTFDLAARVVCQPPAPDNLEVSSHRKRPATGERGNRFFHSLYERSAAMQTASAKPDAITILAFIAGVPILFAFLLAGTPVLIPLLAYRWLSRNAEPAIDAVTVQSVAA